MMTVTLEVIVTLVDKVVQRSIECNRLLAMVEKYQADESTRSRTPAVTPSVSRVSEDVVCGLLAAMKEGQKIEAIKRYRELTGAGLKESKDAIERYWLIFAEMK